MAVFTVEPHLLASVSGTRFHPTLHLYLERKWPFTRSVSLVSKLLWWLFTDLLMKTQILNVARRPHALSVRLSLSLSFSCPGSFSGPSLGSLGGLLPQGPLLCSLGPMSLKEGRFCRSQENAALVAARTSPGPRTRMPQCVCLDFRGWSSLFVSLHWHGVCFALPSW